MVDNHWAAHSIAELLKNLNEKTGKNYAVILFDDGTGRFVEKNPNLPEVAFTSYWFHSGAEMVSGLMALEKI